MNRFLGRESLSQDPLRIDRHVGSLPASRVQEASSCPDSGRSFPRDEATESATGANQALPAEQSRQGHKIRSERKPLDSGENRENLNAKQARHLEEVLGICPRLRSLYLHKERFRLIFNRVKNRQQAERFLRAWIYEKGSEEDPYLAKFISTPHNW